MQHALQQYPSGNFEELEVYNFTRPGSYTEFLGPHCEVTRKKQRGNTWGSVLLGLMILWAHFLLVNLKLKRRNLKPRKKKRNSSSNDQLLKSTKKSKTKETQWGKMAWLFSPVIGSVFRNKHIEGDASLKWMPQQSKLKSDNSITKKKKKRKKKQLSRFTLHWELNNYWITRHQKKGRYNKLNNIFLQKISKSESLKLVNVTLCDKKDFADVIVCVCVCPIFKWSSCPELSKVKVLVTQSCPTLCNPMNCS